MNTLHYPVDIQNGGNPASTVEVLCPYDGTVLGTVERATPSHVEHALKTAYSLYRNRDQWLPLHKRVEILERLAALMEQRNEELALLAASEGGKPLPDSKVEVARAIDGIKLCVEHIRVHHGDVIPMGGTAASAGRSAFTQKEPIGIVVAVSAFNHPLNLIIHQVGAAVAAGCPTIVKPAATTPLSCFNFVNLLREAGLDEPWCRAILPADNQLTSKMVCDERVGFFSFIGSGRVGWSLRSQLAPGTRCALEHGGVAPVIISEDADITHAVNAISKGGFYHAGQVCVSVQRVFVHRKIAEDFAKALVKKASKLKIGDPRKPDTEVGPLIIPEEVTRIHQWVEAARDSGGRVLCGGKPLDNNCYACTVVYDPDDATDLSCKEVFGPVVCVYPYSDMDEAVRRANQLPAAFQAAIFTRDIKTAMYLYRNLDASAVMLNDHTAFRVDNMPFAGLRSSGLGVGGISHTIEDMQIEKMLVINS
jgi:acyl-CoA reductase-like NAD-dependent aldehyde dehydrogenase